MNYDQFVASFRNPEPAAPVASQEGKAVVAGTVLAATGEYCHIEINGAQYEIAPGDVIDVQIISPIDFPKPEDMEPPDKDSGEADVGYAYRGPVVALLTLHGNAMLCRRIPAALVAAVGTWMAVVPTAAKAG